MNTIHSYYHSSILLFISFDKSVVGGLFKMSIRAGMYWSRVKLVRVFSWATDN